MQRILKYLLFCSGQFYVGRLHPLSSAASSIQLADLAKTTQLW